MTSEATACTHDDADKAPCLLCERDAARMNDLTQEQLMKLVIYDPATGRLSWIAPRNGHAKPGDTVGRITQAGYRQTRICRRMYMVHRLIFLYMTGRWPLEIDHIDGDRANNQWTNLREVTRSENTKNVGVPRDNKSGVVGVFWDEQRRWVARIRVSGKLIHLGSFSDLAEAAAARKSAELRYGFHENHGRRPGYRS